MPLKRNIALFFGSFNPIHIGHQKLSEFLVDNQIVDEVWFVLSPCNPLKKQSDLIDEYLRLDMIILYIEKKTNVKVSDIEFTMPIPSYSIDTLNLLSELYPMNNFYLMIGSDNALVFNKWKNYQEILLKYKLLVYPREGYEFKEVENLYPQMRLLKTPLYKISSTQIRQYIAQKKDVSQWLHPSVNQFIIDNNLYQ